MAACACDHANVMACVKCMHTNFQPQLLFEKHLSRHDLGNIYLRPSDVSKICPEAFGCPSNDESLFYDPDMTPWPMRLKKTTGERWHLRGRWRRFVRQKKLSEGQKIKFYEYKCKRGTGAKFLMIVCLRIFGTSLA
ncbi:hypothetical protein FH972_005738 [Carpinus fangiana]|uniref:TF-B3 domain-containing protein n=1 Tax=Carpinus fangiana TaxID=176857 RepID=A0A5N6QQ62_9ROSI|nr:hypothetical protein FH972_005738 [Carpinus fangiana]